MFLESRTFCSWNPESWALESRIQLHESGIILTIGLQLRNPSSTDKESGIQGVESRLQCVLGFPKSLHCYCLEKLSHGAEGQNMY